jgi:hypothetical protein
MPDRPCIIHSGYYGQARARRVDGTLVKLRYAIGGIAAVAALVVLPANAAASGGGQVAGLAAQQCSQERANIGKKAFHKRYGARHTMRACAKRTRSQVMAAVTTANSDCQNELADIGTPDFIDEYGVDPADSLDNAMTECIAEDVDQTLNPDDSVDDGSDDSTTDE